MRLSISWGGAGGCQTKWSLTRHGREPEFSSKSPKVLKLGCDIIQSAFYKDPPGCAAESVVIQLKE